MYPPGAHLATLSERAGDMRTGKAEGPTVSGSSVRKLYSKVTSPNTMHKVWTILAQVLSSLTNLLPGIYAAHVLDPPAFGVFALIQVVYVMSLGALRAAFTRVAMMHGASDTPTPHQYGSIDAVLVASIILLCVGLPATLLLFEPPVISAALTAIGIAVAMGQDAVRMVAISLGQGWAAALNDALWLISMAAALPLVATYLHPSAWIIAAAWLLAAGPGFISGALIVAWRPRIARAWWFMRNQHKLAFSFLSEWSLRVGVSQVSTYAIGLLGGIVVVAGVRASQLLLGPMNIGFQGVQLALTRSVLTKRQSSLSSMRMILRWLSLGMGVSALLLGALMLIAPQAWLAIAVGEQSTTIPLYLPPMALITAAGGFTIGSVMGLQVLHAGSLLVKTRTLTSLITVFSGALGYLATTTALGGLWGLAVGNIIAIGLWESSFRVVYKRSLVDDADTERQPGTRETSSS